MLGNKTLAMEQAEALKLIDPELAKELLMLAQK